MTTTAQAVPDVGSLAPAFELVSGAGDPVSLTDFAGRQAVMLVFYPFAFSGICTSELSAIRDDVDAFQNERVQVLGVSCDPKYSLKAWAQAEGYTFPLLSDFWPHGEVASRYGVFDEQAGRPLRGSFLIDPNGVVRWNVVNGPGDPRDIEAYRAALAAL